MHPRIQQIVIYVTNMDRSLAFYHDALGFTVDNTSDSWSEIAAGGISLALHITTEPAAQTGWMTAGQADLQVSVENLDAARQRLLDHGVKTPEPMLMEDIGLQVLQIHDPDGLTITLSASVE